MTRPMLVHLVLLPAFPSNKLHAGMLAGCWTDEQLLS
jgi:hypothetical protein